MSYDLNVFGLAALPADELIGLGQSMTEVDFLTDGSTGDVTAVLNRRTGKHSFTVDGPFTLDAEDALDWGDASAVVLYSISVVGLDAQDVRHALHFAELLAARIDGHVIDPQTYKPRPTQRDATLGSDTRLYLHVNWYRLCDGASDFAEAYVKAAGKLFPFAVPNKFGTHEPMQGKIVRGDFSGFDRMYREECSVSDLLFKSKVIDSGEISGWTNDLRARFQTIRVTFSFDSIEKAGLEGEIVDFFVEVAQRSSSFFGFAELNTNRYGTAESPAFKGAWGGLPRTAQWMTWYMPEYLEMVRPYLSAGAIIEHPEGGVHRWTERPALINEIRPLIRNVPWIGSDLLAVLASDDDHRILEPAASMPKSLRAPADGSPEALRIEENIARNITKSHR